jgi:glycine cleavage system aminomethyltransferase T
VRTGVEWALVPRILIDYEQETRPMPSTTRRTQQLRPDIAKSPYFSATERAGALGYVSYNHTYWPIDYGRDPVEEYQAISERAVLIDVGCERTAELRGPDALRFADYLCTRDLTKMKPHRARHTVVCEPTGEILCEAIVLRLDDDLVWIGHGPVDFPQWARVIAEHSDFNVDIIRTEVFPLAVQGPRAFEIMQAHAPDAAELKFFQWLRSSIVDVDVIIVRSGYTGAFGYEVYPLNPGEAPKVWDAVVEAGEPYGLMITPMVGPNFERGVTDFRYGDGIGLNPFEARLGRSVDLDARPFIGKDALQRILDRGVRRKLVGVRFGAGVDLPACEKFWAIVPSRGEATSPGLVTRVRNSYYLGETIGYAAVDSGVPTGSRVTVSHPEGIAEAEIVELPFMP